MPVLGWCGWQCAREMDRLPPGGGGSTARCCGGPLDGFARAAVALVLQLALRDRQHVLLEGLVDLRRPQPLQPLHRRLLPLVHRLHAGMTYLGGQEV